MFKKLKPLPNDRYSRTVQVAKERADGVSRGFWHATIRHWGSPGEPFFEWNRRFWRERLATVNGADRQSDAEREAMEQSLLSAGYVEKTENGLRITPAAFDLIRKPTRIERIDRWQTAIEIALLIIFLAHFLVLLPPAIESVLRLSGLAP